MARTLIDTTAGAGDTLKSGGDKLNAMTLDLYGPAQIALRGRPPTLGVCGDSIGDFFLGNANDNGTSGAVLPPYSPLANALFEYSADVLIDGRKYDNGGHNFALGGSGSAHMLSTQLAQIVARPPDVLFMQSWQNDAIQNYGDVATFAPNGENTALGALAAGVKSVVILSVPPKNALASVNRSKALAAMNLRLERFARATPGVVYLDTLGIMLDPAYAVSGASGYVPYRGYAAPTAWGSYSSDGTHDTNVGGAAKRFVIASYLRQIARERVLRASVNDSKIDNTNNPFGNIWGDVGRFVGTAGTVNGSAAGANVATSWTVADNNGVTVTASLGLDENGYIQQRLTLGGTATADATISLAITGGPTYFGTPPLAGTYNVEAAVEMTALAGVRSLVLATSANGNGSGSHAICPGVAPRTQKGILASRRAFNVPSPGNNWNGSVKLEVQSGVSPSGMVGISRFGCYRES